MNLGGAVRLNKPAFCVIVILVLLLLYTYNYRDEPEKPVVNLRQLLTVSIKAAQNGGAEVVATKDHLIIENKGKTKEGVNDSVTTADFRSHCIMLATLKRSFPTLTIISEEAKTNCDTFYVEKNDAATVDDLVKPSAVDYVREEDITVWIDPLDATKEYTEKLYEYVTTMVCVAVKGKPVIGVIYKPFSKELSWAWVGKSHLLNVDTKSRGEDTRTRVVISRSHTGSLKEDLEKALDNPLIELKAGAGYKALEVAVGNADAYVHATAIKKWDVCAGNAIIAALNGKMTTRFGRYIDYAETDDVVNKDGIIATLKNHGYFVERA